MTTFYVRQAGGTQNNGDYKGYYAAGGNYATGDRVIPTRAYATSAAKAFVYECTTAGTGGTEPTWGTTPGGTTTVGGGGTAVFTCRNPTTYADATYTLEYVGLDAANMVSAGDTVYVDASVAETIAAAVTLTFPSNGAASRSSPLKILVVNDGTTTLVSSASARFTLSGGGNHLTVTGGYLMHGYLLESGSGTASTTNITLTTGWHKLHACRLRLLATGGAATQLVCGLTTSNNEAEIVWEDVSIKTGGTASGTILILSGCKFEWRNSAGFGAAVESGSSSPTALASVASSGGASLGVYRFTGLDLSAAQTPGRLVTHGTSSIDVEFRGCALESGVTLSGGTSRASSTSARMIDCDDSTAKEPRRYEDSRGEGTLTHSTTEYVTSDGATLDGTNRYSVKMVGSSTNFFYPLECYLARENDSTSAQTATVEILYDGAADLNDNEVWLELEYPKNSTDMLRETDVSDCAALPGTSGSAQAAGTGTGNWTKGTASVGWRSQKLHCSFTAGRKGLLHAVVKLAANKTVYVDPQIRLS